MRILIFLIIFFQTSMISSGQSTYPKKIIQFGWDYPTIKSLKKNISEVEKQPFDGVAFSFDFKIFDLFDTTVYPVKLFQFDELKELKWTSFTDNFIRVRAQSANGAQWLDDHSWKNIEENLKNISKAVAISGAKGIFFDPEYYLADAQSNPWTFDETKYPSRSFEEIGNYVRNRGRQFIEAITFYKDDTKIFSLWLLSLVYKQQETRPLEKTGMALYPFFVEGMLEGKKKETEIIDANELGYYYKYASQFIESGMQIKQWGMSFMPEKLKPVYSQITVSQPVYYDGIFATAPQFEKGYNYNQKIDWLRENLYNAMKTSDEYVWIYNQRINWYNNTVDSNLLKVVREVRSKVRKEFKTTNQIKGASYQYDFLAKTFDEYNLFSYQYNKKTRQLVVSFHTNNIKELQIYQNSFLIKTVKTPPKNLKINLREFTGGNLILISNTVDNKSSVAFVN